MPDKKRKRLEAMLKLVNDGLSEEKFLQHFKSALKQILNLEKKLIEKINKALIDSDSKHKALKNTTQADLSDLYTKQTSEIDKALKEQENGMNFIHDKVSKLKGGKDGKAGKDGASIKGDTGKDGTEITVAEIRDAFESLEGDDRPDISSIRGLRRLLQRLDDRPLGVGGGFSKMHMEQKFIDDETPGGTVNGANKAFTIKNLPNPVASLKVFADGQRMKTTEDYTLSGKTITFVTAPLTDTILTCDYRK